MSWPTPADSIKPLFVYLPRRPYFVLLKSAFVAARLSNETELTFMAVYVI